MVLTLKGCCKQNVLSVFDHFVGLALKGLKGNWFHWKRCEEERKDFKKPSIIELQSSKKTLKLSQMGYHLSEYLAFYSNQQVSKSSKLLPHSPFMKDDKVLCWRLKLHITHT